MILSEWDETEPIELSDRDKDMIENQLSGKISIDYQRDGKAKIKTKQYVGNISLPDGPSITIKPKAAGGNLLTIMRYARGVDFSVVKEVTDYPEGRYLVETLAYLFLDEMKKVASTGFSRSYVRQESEERFLKGSLNVTRQVQKQGINPTAFECDYEDLTYDNTANRSLLYSTEVLLNLVDSIELKNELNRFKKLLRRKVTLKPVSPIEVRNIHTDRLTRHYEGALEVAELIISNSFIRDIRSGGIHSYSLLIDMNEVFEKVIENAFRDAFSGREDFDVLDQSRNSDLVDGDVTLIPDIVLERGGKSAVVGDAKWKLSQKNNDIYQLVSYILAHETPGIIFYPEQGGEMEKSYSVNRVHKDLKLVEVPTRSYTEKPEKWRDEVVRTVTEEIDRLM